MSWTEALENIDYLAVVLGVVASLVLGALWYEPRVFGTRWMKQVGLKKKDVQNRDGMPVMMFQSLVFYSLVSVVIAALFQMIAGSGAGEGAFLGLVVGFVFGFGPLVVTYGFARRNYELTVIDGGYIVVTCTVIGAIIGQVT